MKFKEFFETKIFNSKFLCRIGFHEWNKWEKENWDIYDSFTGKEIHEKTFQVRTCQICGKLVKRNI